MNLLLIDTNNTGLSYAWRAVQAGHQVRWFIKPKQAPFNNHKIIGNGFKGIEKVDNFVPSLKWADLIMMTGNDDYLERLDAVKKREKLPIWGPTVASAKMEISRRDGMKLLEKAGIEVAPYKTFKSMDDALAHVKKTEERFVFKTMGDNEDKSLTYVSKSPADMVNWIKRMIEEGRQPSGEVMLQQFIDGIELGVSRFMGSDGFVGPYNESFEHKKLMSGGYGCNTGEMGTVAYFTKESKIGKETLDKCEEEFHRMGHTGDLALGFMIPENGTPMPTEFTCRMGWPIANMMLGATQDDPIQWMKDALSGKDSTSFTEDIGCCLVMAHKDFPNMNADQFSASNVPIYGVTKGNKKYLHPQSVKIDVLHDMQGESMVERPIWNTAGDYVMVITGFGANVQQACKRAYKTAGQLYISDPILRDDVGEGLDKKLSKLHAMGYATHCNYA